MTLDTVKSGIEFQFVLGFQLYINDIQKQQVTFQCGVLVAHYRAGLLGYIMVESNCRIEPMPSGCAIQGPRYLSRLFE